MALRKPNGTLRPIAVGEIIRRLTSKVAVELIAERARVLLEPLQLGVKTPNGCEAIVHTARQWLHRHRSDVNKVAVSVDVSNAFNTVYRSAVLRAARVHFPSLVPWIDCCYRHDSVLFTGSRVVASQVVSSCRCVQQGDPLGLVLFALATQLAIADSHAATEALFPGGIDIGSFFLDDGFCAGSAPALRHFLSALVRGIRLVGLEVNLETTEVIPACSSSQSSGPGGFPGCTWVGSSNFKLLGAPLGRRSCVRTYLAGAFLRLGPSWPLSASFQTLKEPFVCFALARVGPRFSILVALSLLMLNSGVSALPIVTFARLSVI